MWPVVYEAKQELGDRVQIVILDYYSPRIEPLRRQYRVFGHPTFVFVDAQGQEKARIVGLAPRERVAEAFDKLVRS